MRARYIRDWVRGSSANAGNHWVQIIAMDVDGINVAKDKNVTNMPGTTVVLNNFTQELTRIVDGNVASSPYCELLPTGQLCYVQVDLLGTYDLKSISVWHYWADGRTYYDTKTQISEDGYDWVTVFDSAVSGMYAESFKGKYIDLMPWTTPKTDWTVLEVRETDFNRMERNIASLTDPKTIAIVDIGRYFSSSDLLTALQELKRAEGNADLLFDQPWDNMPYSTVGTEVTFVDGYMHLRATASNPSINMIGIGSWDPNIARYITLRIKVTGAFSDGTMGFYFANTANPGPTSDQLIEVPYYARGQSDSLWHTIRIDCWKHPKWKTGGNIIGWEFAWTRRLTTQMDIDYTRLYSYGLI